MDRQIAGYMDKQVNTDRWVDRQTNRQTEKQKK